MIDSSYVISSFWFASPAPHGNAVGLPPVAAPADRRCAGLPVRRLLGALVLLLAPSLSAQAPGWIWSTNVGAQVFAMDAHTNVYAFTNGQVIQLDADGRRLQTFDFGLSPGMMQRDAAGFFYYAGLLPGDNIGAYYSYAAPACFLAKYSAAGTLVWSNRFGPTWLGRLNIGDLQLDSAGNIYVGWTFNNSSMYHISKAAKFGPEGTVLWEVSLPVFAGGSYTTFGKVRFGPVAPAGGFVMTIANVDHVVLSSFDAAGTTASITSWVASATEKARPAPTRTGDWWNFEGATLIQRSPAGALLLGRAWAGNQAVVAPDFWDGAHATDETTLARYDAEGQLAWSMSLPSACNAMVTDPHGNRFFSMTDGTVARLGAETILAPVITRQPLGQTVFSGSNALLTVGTSGFTPLRYEWLFNGQALPGQTNNELNFHPAIASDDGAYSVRVSNGAGSVTSAPARLRVRSVALFLGERLLTNGTYVFSADPTFSLRSAFRGGSLFYTLDGSPPSFASTFYEGPFAVSQSAIVRAIGYSADFMESEEADVVNAVVEKAHRLALSWSNGGTVILSSSNVALDVGATHRLELTASPLPGWSFLFWLGDAAGTDPNLSLTMDQDKAVHAVFGTTLSTTVAGPGHIELAPPGGRYAAGTTVQLTGVPDPGNYFGFWGNAATGNTNPLYVTITEPTQTVSAIFGAAPPGQAALTLGVSGNGRVQAEPRANVYPMNAVVSVVAQPAPNQTFLNWSGDASGTDNPLTVVMAQSKTITAHFSSRPIVRVDRRGLEGFTSDGLRFTIVDVPPSTLQVYGSGDLQAWDYLGTVTNAWGEVQFTDPAGIPGLFRFYKAAR